MNSIKTQAPEGATGYFGDIDGEVFYFRIINSEVYQFIDDQWLWVDDIADYPDYYNDLKPL